MKSKLFSNLLSTVLIIVAANLNLSAQGQTTIIEIPGLGGTEMAVYALGSKGHVTGYSYTSGNDASHAFLFGTNGLVDLGTLGGWLSYGNAVNSAGQVAGEADLKNGNTDACLWDGSTKNDLGTLGGTYSSAVAINDAGQVAGTSFNEFYLNEAFLYSNGTLVGLGDLGGGDSWAVAINQAGSVAGGSSYDRYEDHGFLYSAGKMIDLGTLGGRYSTVYALNNLDMVVGKSADANGDDHAFLYANGTMQDLGTLGAKSSWAVGINDLGQVIGLLDSADATRGFIYANGVMTDLGTLGLADTEPYAINNAGQVVGSGLTADWQQHAFLWQNGVLTDLNTILPSNSGWLLYDAQFINDAGQIVGTGSFNGHDGWYLMNPGSVNHSPIAEAGGNQTVECTVSVTLDGSGSSDPDGDTLSYEWRENETVLGREVTLRGTFELGTHYVILKVTEPSGASSEDTVVVTVVDTTPPTVTLPADAAALANASCEGVVPDFTSTLVATDGCTPPGLLTVTQSPQAGTHLGVGSHPVTLVVSDPSGNASTCNVLFTVLDIVAPEITAIVATPNQLTPPNHQMIPITVSVVASDTCDPLPTVRLRETEPVTCNEQTAPGEIEITPPLTVSLAASRDAAGNGRVYTIHVQCVDASGNVSEGSVDVLVPKGHGGDTKPLRAR